MIKITKLQKIKNILRKASATLLVFGLLTTTYGAYLQANVLSAQQETVQALLRVDNVSFPEVNSSPHYNNTKSMGVPKQVIRLYQFYGNKTATAMQNVEVVLQAPVSGSSRAGLFTTTVAPASTDALKVSYSNNNGQSWDYTPSGEVDTNVTHVRWVAQNVPANTVNQSVQAQFQAPEQAANTESTYTSQGFVVGNGVKVNSNSVTFRNMTKPEFNKLAAGEVERTIQGTNDITSVPTPYGENTALQMGQEFGITVYARNVIPETQANNVKIRLEFPTNYATTHTVKAYLSADNAETLIDTTTFTTAQPAKLRYLKNSDLPGRNSCKLTWHGQHQYKLCGDEIATTGYVWTDGPLKFGSAETLQLTVEAMVDGQPQSTPTPTSTPAVTPSATPVVTATPTSTPRVTPTPTASPVVTPVPTQTPRVTPSATPVVTPTATPVITPAPTVTPSPTVPPIVTPSPTPGQSTQLKLCKYEDDDGNGIHNNGENVMSWTFNYTVNGQNNTVDSHWWHAWTQGCAIVNVPSNAQITVSEAQKTGWRPTAVYADGARADSGVIQGNYTYNYTSNVDSVKVLWFLNTFTPVPVPTQTPVASPTATATATPVVSPTPTQTPMMTPSPTVTPSVMPTVTPSASPTVAPTATPAATASPTVTPSASPSPTVIPVANSNYNVTIEKRVDGTRVDGDKVGIQYRVKIKNNSNENFNNFEVRDTLPPDFTYDQNTTEGDITVNPEIQDVSGDDNRRLVWKVATLEKGKEMNFGYRTTGKKEDKNYCNDAKIEKDGNLVSTSQACVRINQSSTQVLGASTDKTLPSTGATQTLFFGLAMLTVAAAGFKLSKHIE